MKKLTYRIGLLLMLQLNIVSCNRYSNSEEKYNIISTIPKEDSGIEILQNVETAGSFFNSSVEDINTVCEMIKNTD